MSKIAVYFIFQPCELKSTLEWVERVHRQASERTRIFGLCNGKLDELEVNRFNRFEFLQFKHIDFNAGVAGGRNIVLSEAKEWGADYFVSIDNDILIPNNYVAEIVGRYRSLAKTNKHVGIISPAVLDINKLIRFFDLSYLIDLFDRSDVEEINEFVYRDVAKRSDDVFYHLGASNWRGCYIRSPSFERWRSRFWTRYFFSAIQDYDEFQGLWNAGRKGVRKDVLNRTGSYLKVSTLPGGLHVFSREYIDAVGRFNEQFNPYGFEDSEFSVRGLFKGFGHFLINNIFVAHDLEERFANRDLSITYLTQGKVKRILIQKYIQSRRVQFACLIDNLLGYSKHIYMLNKSRRRVSIYYVFCYLYGFLMLPRKIPDSIGFLNGVKSILRL